MGLDENVDALISWGIEDDSFDSQEEGEMKKISLIIMATLCFGFGADAWAQEPAATTPSGLGLSALVGMNVCVSNGDEDCHDRETSFGWNLSAVYRFMSFLGGEATFFHGINNIETSGIVSSLGLLFGPKGYVPLGNLDLTVGIQLGWSHYIRKGRDEGPYEYISDGFALGFSAGAEYRLNSRVALGILFRDIMPFYKERCDVVYDRCHDLNNSEHQLVFGLTATYYFNP
jgi:hypothetical protein